jgi:hypothetical protein
MEDNFCIQHVPDSEWQANRQWLLTTPEGKTMRVNVGPERRPTDVRVHANPIVPDGNVHHGIPAMLTSSGSMLELRHPEHPEFSHGVAGMNIWFKYDALVKATEQGIFNLMPMIPFTHRMMMLDGLTWRQAEHFTDETSYDPVAVCAFLFIPYKSCEGQLHFPKALQSDKSRALTVTIDEELRQIIDDERVQMYPINPDQLKHMTVNVDQAVRVL